MVRFVDIVRIIAYYCLSLVTCLSHAHMHVFHIHDIIITLTGHKYNKMYESCHQIR